MKRQCSICSHEQVEEINRQLVRGVSLRQIAGQFGTSKSSLSRHLEHLPEDVLKAEAARELSGAEDVMLEVKALKVRAEAILSKAEKANKLTTALQGVRELRGVLELYARLAHMLEQRIRIEHQVNLPSAIVAAYEKRKADGRLGGGV